MSKKQLEQMYEDASEKLSSGKPEEAVLIYQAVLRKNPKEVAALNNMGLAFIDLKKYKEAVEIFKNAVDLAPGLASLHYNQGLALHKTRMFKKAIQSYQKAIAIDPDYKEPLQNMGAAFKETGDLEEAVSCYRRLFELAPDDENAKYMLDSLTQQNQHDTAPKEYVTALFDGYAEIFEDQLVKNLSYHIPMVLRKRFADLQDSPGPFEHMLDLGCGTGLMGQAFHAIASKITGVDLSGKMIEHARDKGIYESLYQGDISTFLGENQEEGYDLVTAADVFVYLGRLDKIFSLVSSVMKNNGYLLFSTEDGNEFGGFSLLPTGRYGHCPTYIQSLARNCHFLVRLCQQTKIRKERGKWLSGNIFILQLMRP